MQLLKIQLTISLLLACIIAKGLEIKQEKVDIYSPDSKLKLTVQCDDSLSYSVSFKGVQIITPSAIGIVLTNKFLGKSPRVVGKKSRLVNDTIRPLYGKFDLILDSYNETRLDFEGDYSLVFRTYNDAVTYRFVTNINSGITVENEKATFNVAGTPSVIFPETNTFTSWEVSYINYQSPSAIVDLKRALTPLAFSYQDGTKVIIAESDVLDYPGMYITKEKNHFKATFAQYPDSIALGSWGNFVSVVQRRSPYIARCFGKREFPWRVIIVTDDDKTLLTNEIIYKLSKPQAISDASWIKPGKATWEWWHDAMLPGEDTPSGMDNRNTRLYKRYIDFAAKYHLEYLMLDAGWSNIFDLSKVNPKIDIQELINYGKSKNVGVFLWCVAPTLVKDADRYMKMMADWGVKGIKVDFFDRDDQLAMNWYELIAQKAANYKLMVDFHGCSKPTGMQRMYPNIINYEAVRGAECSKWDLTANPEYHLTFPFLRMLAGSLDYTPGSMRNRTQQMFKPLDPGMPLTQGTRCHELAMYVVFDQYLAMLCDSPTEYEKNSDIMRFLADVPVTFNDTKILSAKMGAFALVAKRKNSDWYIGGMTDWTARETEINFNFLKPGVKYMAEIYSDSNDSNTYADHFTFESLEVDSSTVIRVKMASGGGVALHTYPIQLSKAEK
jgi:alpha-glucosidase